MKKVKVCGMRNKENIEAILQLKPYMMGFIFYANSSRNVESIPKNINFGETLKVGVFVNEEIEVVIEKCKKEKLDLVQLHGEESIHYCQRLKNIGIQIIKAFAIGTSFDFEHCMEYEDLISFFLFDAKGKLPGGNGISYDWTILNNYSGEKPFLLSGGICLKDTDKLLDFNHEKCIAFDVNSGFEKEAAMKDGKQLTLFFDYLRQDKK